MDLVDEYFKRDLTPEEENRLAELLSSSPQAAQRMAEGMAGLYLSSGLPEPQWPGGTPPWGHSKGSLLKPLLPLGLLLLGVGFLAFKWFTAVPMASIAPQPEAPPEEVHRAVRPLVKPATPKKNPAQIIVPSPTDNFLMPPDLRPQGKVYQQLSVVVNPKTPGLVTVQVLDKSGSEIRALYAGIIPAGRRVFNWDGKREDGMLASPGVYVIEVRSGSEVMRQEVTVEGN